jgi:LAS superfamily LD-carboxypeptidase LdcB
MLPFFRCCSLCLLALFSMHSVLAESPDARDTRSVLVMNRPALSSEPGGRGTQTDLRAGMRLAAGESQIAPISPGAPTKTSWTRVSFPATAATRKLHTTPPMRSGWMPASYLAPPPAPFDPHKWGAIGLERVDRTHGIAPEYIPPDLVKLTDGYEKDKDYALRREAARALNEMLAAARQDGVPITIVSSYRSWERQQVLYENKIRKSGPNQNTVAVPGHSEHQLGTAVDLGDGTSGKTEATLLMESFGETPAGQWLHIHAPAYGFAISFTRHNQPETGIAPEPWHYRYWGKPLATEKHRLALGE